MKKHLPAFFVDDSPPSNTAKEEEMLRKDDVYENIHIYENTPPLQKENVSPDRPPEPKARTTVPSLGEAKGDFNASVESTYYVSSDYHYDFISNPPDVIGGNLQVPHDHARTDSSAGCSDAYDDDDIDTILEPSSSSSSVPSKDVNADGQIKQRIMQPPSDSIDVSFVAAQTPEVSELSNMVDEPMRETDGYVNEGFDPPGEGHQAPEGSSVSQADASSSSLKNADGDIVVLSPMKIPTVSPRMIRHTYLKYLYSADLVVSRVDDVPTDESTDDVTNDASNLEEPDAKENSVLNNAFLDTNGNVDSLGDLSSKYEPIASEPPVRLNNENVPTETNSNEEHVISQDYNQFESVTDPDVLDMKSLVVRRASAVEYNEDQTSDDDSRDSVDSLDDSLGETVEEEEEEEGKSIPVVAGLSGWKSVANLDQTVDSATDAEDVAQQEDNDAQTTNVSTVDHAKIEWQSPNKMDEYFANRYNTTPLKTYMTDYQNSDGQRGLSTSTNPFLTSPPFGASPQPGNATSQHTSSNTTILDLDNLKKPTSPERTIISSPLSSKTILEPPSELLVSHRTPVTTVTKPPRHISPALSSYSPSAPLNTTTPAPYYSRFSSEDSSLELGSYFRAETPVNLNVFRGAESPIPPASTLPQTYSATPDTAVVDAFTSSLRPGNLSSSAAVSVEETSSYTTPDTAVTSYTTPDTAETASSGASDKSVVIQPYGERRPAWLDDSLDSSYLTNESDNNDYAPVAPHPASTGYAPVTPFSTSSSSTFHLTPSAINGEQPVDNVVQYDFDSVDLSLENKPSSSTSLQRAVENMPIHSANDMTWEPPVVQYHFDDDIERGFEDALSIDYMTHDNTYNGMSLCFESIKEEQEDALSQQTSISGGSISHNDSSASLFKTQAVMPSSSPSPSLRKNLVTSSASLAVTSPASLVATSSTDLGLSAPTSARTTSMIPPVEHTDSQARYLQNNLDRLLAAGKAKSYSPPTYNRTPDLSAADFQDTSAAVTTAADPWGQQQTRHVASNVSDILSSGEGGHSGHASPWPGPDPTPDVLDTSSSRLDMSFDSDFSQQSSDDFLELSHHHPHHRTSATTPYTGRVAVSSSSSSVPSVFF